MVIFSHEKHVHHQTDFLPDLNSTRMVAERLKVDFLGRSSCPVERGLSVLPGSHLESTFDLSATRSGFVVLFPGHFHAVKHVDNAEWLCKDVDNFTTTAGFLEEGSSEWS